MPSLLVPRDTFSDAKDTLGSWDKCMAKTYCKWPVIVAIVIGSLIVLTVVFCVARCLCCGAEVACCCFKCCSCCCPSGRGGRGHKRMDSSQPPPAYPSFQSAPLPPPNPINNQYKPHAVPAYRGAEPERPQFATFEATRKPANEDSLPAMPSWEDARDVHVEETVIPEKKGDMEMDRLDHNGSVTNSSVSAAAIAGGPRRSPGRSPVQRSPTRDDYGFPGASQNDSLVGAAPQRFQNSPGPFGRHQGQQYEDYRRGSPAESMSPVYGAGAGPGFGQNQQYGRASPNQAYNQAYNRPGPGRSPLQQNAYNRVPHSRSPIQPSPYSDNFGSYSDVSQPNRVPSPISPPNNSYAPISARSHTPGSYAIPSPTERAPLTAAYPGQETYSSPTNAYPGQQTYQAFKPQDQHPDATRKPVDGSWKEV